MKFNPFPRSAAAALMAMTLNVGCGSQQPSGGGIAASAQAEACPPEANLLQDAEFATLAGGPKRVWGARQHSRGQDFRATADAGLLTIEKIGHEPWFVMSQRVDREFPAGTELQYDALLTLDTHEPKDRHGFGYVSGLHLVGKSGRRSVVRATGEHEPNIGQHPEQRVVSRVTPATAISQIDVGSFALGDSV